MTFTPRFVQALFPLLGAMLVVACSSEGENPGPSQSNAGSAGSAGSAAGASGSAGVAGSAGAAGDAGAAGSSGASGSAGGALCVGPVVEQPSAGLDLPFMVAATDQALFAVEHDLWLGGNTVLRSTDGVTFERVIDVPITGILQVAATHDHVYLASWNRLIEGDATLSTWHDVTVPDGTWSVGEIRTSDNRVVVPLDGSLPYSSTGDGVWERLADPNIDTFASVQFAIYDGNRAYGTGGCFGGVVVRNDEKIWSPVEGLPEWGYTDLSFLPDGAVLASRVDTASGSVSLARLDVGATVWSDLPGVIPTGGLNRLINTPDGLVAIGAKGGFISTDRGSSWSAIPGSKTNPGSAAAFKNKLFVGGEFGLQSSVSGEVLALSDLPLRSLTPTRIEALSSGLAVHGKSGWLTWKSSTQRFESLLDGYIQDVQSDASNHAIALHGDGSLWLSSNGGASWEHDTSTTLPVGFIVTMPGFVHGVTFFSSSIWEGDISCVDPSSSHLYSRGFWRRSATGELVDVSAGLPAIFADCAGEGPRVPQVLQVFEAPAGLIATTDGSGAFLSTDDGLSWQAIPGSAGVTEGAVVGDQVWLATSDGLLRSSDGGRLFSRITGVDGAQIHGISSWNSRLAVAVSGAASAVLIEANPGELEPLVGLEGLDGTALQQDKNDLLVGVDGHALYRVGSCSVDLGCTPNRPLREPLQKYVSGLAAVVGRRASFPEARVHE